MSTKSKKRRFPSKDQILYNLELFFFNMPYFVDYQIKRLEWIKRKRRMLLGL